MDTANSSPEIPVTAAISPAEPQSSEPQDSPQSSEPQDSPQDSYVKLAMRNMVRKGRQSLLHYGLTVIGLIGVLVGLAYLTR